MRSFTVQYSVMKNDPVPSTWPEHTKVVKADSAKEAIHKFNRNREGNPWMILDCWES